MKKAHKIIGFGLLSIAAIAITAAGARDRISIVGSSTVFPFSSAVAEQFAAGGKFATPKVESAGTGGGMAIFCKGTGVGTPDITNASRPMKLSEFQTCLRNGVKEIGQVKIGYDGIVVANAKSGTDFSLTTKQLYLGLAKTIPTGGKMVPNWTKTWADVDRGPGLSTEAVHRPVDFARKLVSAPTNTELRQKQARAPFRGLTVGISVGRSGHRQGIFGRLWLNRPASCRPPRATLRSRSKTRRICEMNGPHPPAPPESFDGFDLLGHHGPSFNAKAIAVCPPAITRQRLERVPVVHRSRQVRPA